jgi:REP element-mobilizing transposase RayT
MANRKSIRLTGYNYSYQGYYFITINTHHRRRRFGYIRRGIMHESTQAAIVREVWMSLSLVYDHVDLDAFVIMPDHIHGIIHIRETTIEKRWDFSGNSEEYRIARRSKIIPLIVGRLKMLTSKQIHETYDDTSPVWQRNYYERLIPDDEILRRTRLYIHHNPVNWKQ